MAAKKTEEQQELERLRDFARRVLEGRYGPTLINARTRMDSAEARAIVGQIDAELRQRAKVALDGGNYIFPEDFRP